MKNVIFPWKLLFEIENIQAGHQLMNEGFMLDRFFLLQALAFRGEEVEPPRHSACGVSTFPLSPVGVKCLPLQSTLSSYVEL
ncbi:hypothetical protein [Bacillus sp. Marseille-Q1617]|uniref:hypothetical protein n=1 Tax=Bacillus sp. Marseille-Q1617 TaxID=2736887 RepID=UPI00158EF7B9|nr:hypothetical protein [Bacillus sp. Marseille-Q1617]